MNILTVQARTDEVLMLKYADEVTNSTMPEKFLLILDLINGIYFRSKLISF